MTVIATPPFPSYFDVDGSPLDNGYIYFGVVNQNPETNPVVVYWDADYTQPVSQPVRTSGGYVVRSGTPASIYANTEFSITVLDKNRKLVYRKLKSEVEPTTAQTAPVDTNNNQVATTAYVINQGYIKAAAAAATYLPLTGGTIPGTLRVNMGSQDGIRIGADNGLASITDNTVKVGTLSVPHYQNASAAMGVIGGVTTSTDNTVEVGGNSALLNSATRIRFFTVSTNTGGVGTERARIDSNGFGLGAIPSAWPATWPALELNNGALSSLGGSVSGQVNITSNAYASGNPDIGLTTWRYVKGSAGSLGPAGRYTITNATHSWHVAPGGVAGNAITFRQAMTLAESAIPGVGTTSPQVVLQIDGGVGVQSINGGQIAGNRNRIINGKMEIDQRNNGAAQTINNTTAYALDRWYVNFTGGAGTVQRVTGSGEFANAMRLTGNAAITSALFGQKIESFNISDLAGKTVTVRARLSSSVLTSITWTARHPGARDDYSSVTSIASGSISINTTPTDYLFQVALPAGVANGLEIYFITGSFTSGTLDVTGVQVELGNVATSFEHRIYSNELAMCQWYFETGSFFFRGYDVASGSVGGTRGFVTTKRAVPVMTLAPFSYSNASGAIATNITRDSVGFSATVTATGAAQGFINWTASSEIA